MAASESYDHAEKAGNAGDVWKHFILLAITEALIKKRSSSPQSEPFVYVDTHAAEGRYLLPPKGDWQRGLGAIRPHLQQYPEWPYFRLLSRFAVEEENVYRGSWHLVGSYLHEQKVPFEMHVAENNQTVKENLDAIARSLPFSSHVSSYCQNGFELPARLPRVDLLLVDPPYGTNSTDWDTVVRMLPALQRVASCLVWYPITNKRFKPDDFIRKVSLPSYEIHWLPMNPGGNLKGCGVIGGGQARAILDHLHPQLDRLSRLLHAQFHLVQP
jgi:23S rRNA A2030 N6-methylase RlmJ